MTPKEKAKELYDKYEFVYIQNYTSKHEVKQCALIAVNEILNFQENLFITKGSLAYQYWEQVKTDIEKL